VCGTIGNRWTTELTEYAEPHRYANRDAEQPFMVAVAYLCRSVRSALSVFQRLPLGGLRVRYDR